MGLFSGITKGISKAFKGVTSFLDSSAGGLLTSIGGKLFDNSLAGRRADDANSFSSAQFANRYRTTVADMKGAGLNPMLAYTTGVASAPQGVMAQPSGDSGQLYLNARMNSAQVANIEADTENKRAQAELIAGQAAQAWSSAGLNSQMQKQVDATVEKIGHEVRNLQAEHQRIRAAAEELLTQAQLNFQKGATEEQIREQMRATIAKLRTETSLNLLDIKAAESLGNIGRESGQLRPFIDILKGIILNKGR